MHQYYRFFIVLPLLLLLSTITTAESGNDSIARYSVIHANWTKLSSAEYVDNLVACDLRLQEYKWSKNIWPKENKSPKPAFSEVVDVNTTRQKVHEILKMQSILADRFNIIITDKMLQHDLDRMASSTKNAKELRSLFALFNNNPNTVAQCISRPYLVIQKTQNNYNYNSEIHAGTNLLAEAELQTYLSENESKSLTAEINTTTFEIEHETYQGTGSNSDKDRRSIKLSSDEFISITQQLKNNTIQEKDYGFIYSETLEQSDRHIKIKTLGWQKSSFNSWLQFQVASNYQTKVSNLSLKLPKIRVSNNHTALKAGRVGNTWETRPARVDGRYLHTAIWTGSEMIIWGGEQFSKLNTGGRYDPATDSWRSTSIGVNVPSARIEHSAVWTGTEMIVWGGDTGSVLTNSGGRYDPLTDSWQPTSRGANVPSNRNFHTAVWSGTEMIIWGGNTNPLNSGGRYNPTTNSWQATSIDNNTPNERLFHKAIWAENKMIVWGGFISGNYFNTGGIYDPVTDSWEATSTGANVPGGRMNHTVIWTGSEMIVWGGFNGAYRNSGARLDPVTNSWLPTSLGANVPVVRGNHTATWTGNEMVVWGGINGGSSLDTGGRYDPVNDSWLATSMTNAPGVRSEHTAVWTGNEVIVWGGHVGSTDFNTGGRYNPVADSWQSTSIGDFPTGRYRHSAIWTGTEMIIWGGLDLSTAFNTGGRYNPATNSWHSTSLGANVPGGRYGHTAIWTGTQMIVWGGENTNNELKSGGRYNPANDSWLPTSTGANSPAARTDHSMVWTGNEVIIWGGYTSTCCTSRINTGGRYDPDSDSWQPTSLGANVPSARNLHTSIWTGDEMIVWGGFQGSNNLNTGSRYNPDSDSWLPTSTTTAARASHTAIWTGSEMIVWGGFNNGTLRTGSRYDPIVDSWQSTIIDGNTPPVRYLHSAIWTGSEMIVWGGSGAFPDLDTGGRYNPVTDSWLATQENIPLRRNSHTAIWTGKEMIVWGGIGVSSLPNSVEFYYPYSTYVIGGTLSGLNGDQVILQNNNNDDLTLTTNGDFEFDTAIAEGLDYEVTVLSDPQNPAQTCSVSMGSGVNTMADVGNVEVDCVNDFFNVGVTVNGLASGNSVFLENNGGDLLEVSSNNSLTHFSTQVSNGLDYLITFNTQPTSPNQVCSIEIGEETGTVNAADVNVAVNCVTLYSIGVTVTGLSGNNSIELTTNSQSLDFSNNTSLNFPNQLLDGTVYAVVLTAQPSSPDQVCSITGGNGGNNDGSGTLSGLDAAVAVDCVNTYNINVTVSGLDDSNFIELTTNSQSLVFNSNTSLNFSSRLLDGTAYTVLLTAQPTGPNQTCTITGGNSGNNDGSGTLVGGDVSIDVNCITNTYFIGGTVSGLLGGNYMVIQNNGGDDEIIMTNGAYIFATPIPDGQGYNVLIDIPTENPIQPCVVNNNAATLVGFDVDDVDINCEFGLDLIYRNGFDDALPN